MLEVNALFQTGIARLPGGDGLQEVRETRGVAAQPADAELRPRKPRGGRGVTLAGIEARPAAIPVRFEVMRQQALPILPRMGCWT